MFLFLLLFFLILFAIITGYSWITLSQGDEYQTKPDATQWNQILYSYGLFSSEPMSDNMKQTISQNVESTQLPYLVIDANQIQMDLKEIEIELPGITDIYNKIPRGVGKSDLARMISLYLRGGHYADLDVEFKQRPPIKEKQVIIYTEHFNILEDCFTRIANYALSSPPKHPFIKHVIQEIMFRVNELQDTLHPWKDTDVLYITGPDVITSVYYQEKKQQKQTNNDANVIRLSWIESRRILKHRAQGSWRHSKQ